MTGPPGAFDVDDVADGDDPRVTSRYLRSADGDGIVLVGVTHDHPASVARAEAVVGAADPDVIGLEVPPVVAPVYRHLAGGPPDGTPFGGEFVAAVRAAPAARVVGIDVDARWMVGLPFRACRTESPSLEQVPSLARQAASLLRRAAYCRLAAATGLEVAPTRPVDADRPVDGTPAEQAAHERRAVARSSSFLRAVELPAALTAFDELREAHMADRLRHLARVGSVVGLIGIAHLDGVHDRITGS